MGTELLLPVFGLGPVTGGGAQTGGTLGATLLAGIGLGSQVASTVSAIASQGGFDQTSSVQNPVESYGAVPSGGSGF